MAKKTVVYTVPSDEERELTKQVTKLGKMKIKQFVKAGKLTNAQGKVARQQIESLKESFKREDELVRAQPIEELIGGSAQTALERQPHLDSIFGQEASDALAGSGASDEQKRLIDEAISGSIAAGSNDIAKFANDQAIALRDELIPASGLRPRDTVNIDRMGKIGEEAVRQQAQLVQRMRAQQAQDTLNFPLAANSAEAQRRGALLNFGTADRQFQDQTALQLQDSAFQKRAGFLGNAVNTSANLASGNPSASALGSLAGNRPESSVKSSQSGIDKAGQFIDAIGSAVNTTSQIGQSAQQFGAQ